MRIIAAYVTVVLLWGTTPLAIKWSGEGPGFLFGVTARMATGTVCVLALLLLTRQRLPLHRGAVLSYGAGAVQIFGAMLSVYWSSQFIPSGWISVVFGLSPLLTALLAALWLGERALGPRQLLAYAVGVSGLLVMFGSARQLGGDAVLGVAGVLVSAVLQCGSAVWIKRLNTGLPALRQLAGSLLLAMPAYLTTWILAGETWPAAITHRSLLAILYLGIVATTFGFSLYFFLLHKLTVTALSLISLVSPILALLIGHWVNQEPLTMRVLTGTGLVMSALALYHQAGRAGISDTRRR